MTGIDDRAKLKCVERELALRRRVYRARVADRRMSVLEADHEIRCMEAIRDDYRAAINWAEIWAKPFDKPELL